MAEAHGQTTGQMLPAEPQRLTVAELFTLWGDKSVEVSNGEIIEMSPNQRQSMGVALRVYDSLKAHTLANDLGEVWLEVAYVLDADENTNWVYGARQPDVSFVAKERVTEHNARYGSTGPWLLAPDLAVEVVSPTDKYSDVIAKVIDYLRYGVRLALIIDPKTRTVRVHTQDDPDGKLLSAADTLTGNPVLPGWSMPLSEMFGAAD